MEFSVIPFAGDLPMKPWPSLAARAFCLKGPGKDSLFFFDAAPSDKAAPQGNAAKDAIQRVLVLIHGLGDEADSWRHIIPLLNAQGYRVLALDLPGFGRSISSHKVNIKKHAEAVIKLLEIVLGLPSSLTRVFLVGSSMGSMIAEQIAIQKPRLVHGLILIDGSIPGGPSNPGLIGVLKLLFNKKWYRAYRKNPNAAWISLYPYYADLDAMPREDKDFLLQRVKDRVESLSQEQAFFATQRSLIFNFAKASWFARGIRKFKGEIFLVWGEMDRIIPVSFTAAFRACRPDAELVTIPGAGHLPQQEKPEETARVIAKFAAGLVDRN